MSKTIVFRKKISRVENGSFEWNLTGWPSFQHCGPTYFQSSGIDPLSNDLLNLKRIRRGVANCLLSSFNTLVGGGGGVPGQALVPCLDLIYLACPGLPLGLLVHQLKLYYLTFLPSEYLYFRKKVIQNICFFCFRNSHICPSPLLRGLIPILDYVFDSMIVHISKNILDLLYFF